MSHRHGWRRPHLHSAHEHVAEPPVTGGGHELIAPRERTYSGPARHASRFRWATVALFVLAACSLAAAVALSSSGGRSTALSSGSWSAWTPPDSGLAGAQEIADFLAPYYRATASTQLAVITAENLNNGANPLQVVVPSSGTPGSLLPLPASSTIVYNMCGVGSADCSIGVGKPSMNRTLLLRREALELALYTFKYIPGAATVVAVLPPGHTLQCTGICAKPQEKPVVKPLDIAIAFDRAELTPWLARPLRATLPEDLPPAIGQMTGTEAYLVGVLTGHGLFSERTQRAQDGSTVISLSPMPPQ
jgi:hypothetical protein